MGHSEIRSRYPLLSDPEIKTDNQTRNPARPLPNDLRHALINIPMTFIPCDERLAIIDVVIKLRYAVLIG